MIMKTLARTYFHNVKSAVDEHEQLRSNALNLVASENVTSHSVRQMVASDFMHRYSEWENHDVEVRWGFGLEHTIYVEKILLKLVQRIFETKHCEIRPLSGQVAMLGALCGILHGGELVMSVGRENGAAWYGPNQLVDYRSESLVFDTHEWNVDVDASSKLIRKKKPRALILGSSFYIFPHPVKELRKIADEVGASIIYDGAHVLGLIAGKRWPNPIKNGADVLLGSTHKTLPGPQKGLIITKTEKLRRKISEALFPSMIDNHHLHNSAALAVALTELDEFGEDYADQIVKNAKALASGLSEEGFNVVGEHKGFTRSHQVLFKLSDLSPHKAALLLEKARIFTNMMEIPKANGLRIGVTEVTRTGMKERDMPKVARLISRVLIDRRNPAHVAREVRSLVSNYRTVHFCFDRAANAYHF